MIMIIYKHLLIGLSRIKGSSISRYKYFRRFVGNQVSKASCKRKIHEFLQSTFIGPLSQCHKNYAWSRSNSTNEIFLV